MDKRLIVKFSNSEKTYKLTEDVINKYPSSVLYGYYHNDKRSDNECILEIEPNDFKQIRQVMIGEILESDLSPEIKKIANAHGLTNDVIYALELHYQYKTAQKCQQFEEFFNSGKLMKIKDKMIGFYERFLSNYPHVHQIYVVQYPGSLDAVFLKKVPIFCSRKVNEFPTSGCHTIDLSKIYYTFLPPPFDKSKLIGFVEIDFDIALKIIQIVKEGVPNVPHSYFLEAKFSSYLVNTK